MTSRDLAVLDGKTALPATQDGPGQFVTVSVGGQWFGIPVSMVRDVLRPQRLTRIPLARPEIIGVINLRGRIVTVLDVRRCLGLPERSEAESRAAMYTVVEHSGEPYGLVVDAVGEVMAPPLALFEPLPPNLAAEWQQVSAGVYRLESRLLMALNVEALLDLA